MIWTTTSKAVAARTALRAGVSVTVLAASGALLLSACSSSSGSSGADGKPSGSASASASGAPSGGANNAAAMDKYRQCLSQNGVNLPTFNRPSGGARPSGRPSGGPSGRPSGGRGGGFGGGGFPGPGGASPDAATQKALTACASLRPQYNGRGGAGGGGGANSTALQAFTSCLKDHGVTLPTPSAGATGRPGGGGGGFGGLRGLNTSDPKTAQAYNTCKALLPQRPQGAPSASPSA